MIVHSSQIHSNRIRREAKSDVKAKIQKFTETPSLSSFKWSLTALQEYPFIGKSVILVLSRKISRFARLVSTSACKHGGVRKKLNINYYKTGKEPVNIWFFHTGKLLPNITFFHKKDINVNASDSINPMVPAFDSGVLRFENGLYKSYKNLLGTHVTSRGGKTIS